MEFTFGQNIAKQKGQRPALRWADWLALAVLIGVLALIARLAFGAPKELQGPSIVLSPAALPRYALLSLGRMAAAFILSFIFSMVYGRQAAYNPRAGRILLPLLDILQSVPILSFLPMVLLGLTAVLPQGIAVELSSIILIFTSQAWNLTFAWYQSLTTLPTELGEASAIFRLNPWLRFKTLELPFANIGLVWNSMMSWAGGWFFLMAAEIFTVGNRDFRLPGLGAYLHEASVQGNLTAIAWGLGTLVLVILLLDQLVWRPLIAWSNRFKLEMVENENPPTSWFYDFIHSSPITQWVGDHITAPLGDRLDLLITRRMTRSEERKAEQKPSRRWTGRIPLVLAGAALAYALVQAVQLLLQVPGWQWGQIGLGLGATTLRVAASLVLALLWTVPVGVAIGSNPRVAAVLQPVVQIAASVPATALFPVLLMIILRTLGSLNVGSVLFMLLGTQWYILFNVIAGANAIPQDLKYTAQSMRLSRWETWKTLILPALFPYLITGAITASGGAWNASIVAEYVSFGGGTYFTTGIGSLVAQATAAGNYPLLLAATLSMILAVASINRLVWRRLYGVAEENYRME